MAELAISERLQPSLLDRLTDSNPGDERESREERVIDVRRLRDILERDLAWLLNTINFEDQFDPDRYPQTARSVVNYGLSVITGNFTSDARQVMVRRSLEQAIRHFEPRLNAGSLAIDPAASSDVGKNVLAFDIRGDMWAQPMPLELYLRSEIDVTTGETSIERKG